MKVIIEAKQRRLKIPIPMCVITTGVRVSALVGKHAVKKSLKQNTEFTVNNNISDMSKYIDIVDYKILLKAIKKMKKYKGLKIVEVESSKGEKVLITI